MGSTMVTATDESYNPAMIVRDRPALAFRYAVTDFDNADDTTFVVWGLDATVPLSDRDAIKLAYADLDTGREPTSLIPSPGARLRLTGQHASIVYGRELTDRLRVGVALAVLLDSDISIAMPQIGEIVHISGRPNYDGARLGVDYDIDDRWRVAAQYTFYSIDARLRDNPNAVLLRDDLRARELICGLEFHPDDRWALAGEMRTGRFSTSTYKHSLDAVRLGAEYQCARNIYVRAGLSDGNPTAGAAYEDEEWAVRFAWLHDQYEDELRPVFGHSESFYGSVQYRF
jgi:hypothetical protein